MKIISLLAGAALLAFASAQRSHSPEVQVQTTTLSAGMRPKMKCVVGLPERPTFQVPPGVAAV